MGQPSSQPHIPNSNNTPYNLPTQTHGLNISRGHGTQLLKDTP